MAEVFNVACPHIRRAMFRHACEWTGVPEHMVADVHKYLMVAGNRQLVERSKPKVRLLPLPEVLTDTWSARGCRDSIRAHMEQLQPDPAYLRLFREIVLDVWRTEQARARDSERMRVDRVSAIRSKLERLEEAFIYQHSIDRATYDRQHDRIEEELALAEVELQESRIDSIDVDGVLVFAEHLIGNLGRMWIEADLLLRQKIQSAIFPKGLPFDGRGFGTAPTCLGFMQLQQSEGVENGMASPPEATPSDIEFTRVFRAA